MIYDWEAEKETLCEWLDSRKFAAAKAWLQEQNAVDIAALIEELPEKQELPAYRLLPKAWAAEAFA